MTEVLITSIFKGFDQKTICFGGGGGGGGGGGVWGGVLLVQVQ